MVHPYRKVAARIRLDECIRTYPCRHEVFILQPHFRDRGDERNGKCRRTRSSAPPALNRVVLVDRIPELRDSYEEYHRL